MAALLLASTTTWVSANTASVSIPTTKTLMATLINKLPENLNHQALQNLSQSNQRAGDAWIAGGVDVVIKHENDSLTGNRSYESWEMGAQFPIWLSGQSHAKQQLGQNYQQLMQSQDKLLHLQASKILRRVIWNLKTADITVNFRRKNHEQTLALQKLVKQRVEAGESPKIDLFMAEQASLAAFKQLTLAQQNDQISLKDYKAWTNTQSLPANFSENKQTLPLMENPLIKVLSDRVSIENEKLSLAQKSRKKNPIIYLGSKTDKSRQTTDNTSLVAQITFPLGSNKQTDIFVAEQNHAKSLAEIALMKAKQQLLIDQKNSQIKLIQAQRMLVVTQQQLKLSQKIVQLATHAYQQGETSIQVLLQMTQKLYDDELNFELSQVNQMKTISDYNQIQGVSLP